MKKLGLVGGISWVSTIDYYRYINEGVNHILGGLNFAECIIYSVNYGEIHQHNTNGDLEAAFEVMVNAVKSLESSGAEAVVLCANTAHMHTDSLAKITNLPIIHVVDVTAKAIRNQQLKKVGLLGTKLTMEMDFYTSRLSQGGVESIVPDSSDRAYIQQTLQDELQKGIIKEETKEGYLKIIDQLIANGAEGIVLGCTEIPLLLSQADVRVPIFDTTKIHADAAVKFALS